MSVENAIYEAAQAINRLVLLKTLELHAVNVREGMALPPAAEDLETSIQKAGYDLGSRGCMRSWLTSVANDAETAIVNIHKKGAHSQAIADDREKL